jgi:D-alanine-D-alanine ligase
MTETSDDPRITILFGGLNKERLVSVATAQALHGALPAADLWFWDIDDGVHAASSQALLAHDRPFEQPFTADGAPIGPIAAALDRARAENRLLVLGLHGGSAENGELQVMCELRGVPFTGSGSASSNLAFDKVGAKRFAALAGVPVAGGIALDDLEAALTEHGRLIAKPSRDGSSYGLLFVNGSQDLVAVRNAAKAEDYVIEPFVAGTEATCGVLEQADGTLIALPPIEIIPADGGFDYEAKYLAKSTQEICPGRFSPEVSAGIMDLAVKAHRAMSCAGYSRSDFIVSANGPIYLETNTLPGLTRASLYPKALGAQGISFVDFLNGQIDLAMRRAGQTLTFRACEKREQAATID